ncbi:MAG: hypothetical protein ACXW38_11210 [Nitrospira sp.]
MTCVWWSGWSAGGLAVPSSRRQGAKVMRGGHDPTGDGLSGTSILPRILPMSKLARMRAVPAQVAGRICRYPMKRRGAVERSDNPTMDRP